METGGENLVEPRSQRAWRTWVAVVVALVCLAVILVFILENSKEVPVSLFGASVRMPIGVAILFGAILGGALVVLVELVRVLRGRTPGGSSGAPIS